MKIYDAHTGSPHVSSNGFTNHFGEVDVKATLKRVWEDHPEAIVLNGDDDWFAPVTRRPATLAYKVVPDGILGYFHTGISGIAKSGVVLTSEAFEDLVGKHPEVLKHCKTYRPVPLERSEFCMSEKHEDPCYLPCEACKQECEGEPTAVLEQCGCCDHWHPAGFTGDCRDDKNRYAPYWCTG